VTPATPEMRARFEALAARVAEPVRRFALRRTDPDTAQDVVAETLLIAWRRLDVIPAAAELPWCYAVAGNLVGNARRSARRQQSLIARIAQTERARVMEPPDTSLPDPELHRALARLRPGDRQLLALWAWEDLSPGDIAAVMDLSVNAVNIRLHRARRRLADLLDATAGKAAGDAGQNSVEEKESL
jgi:RNA polymerase sigma-70 factor (ECF subfamily)